MYFIICQEDSIAFAADTVYAARDRIRHEPPVQGDDAASGGGDSPSPDPPSGSSSEQSRDFASLLDEVLEAQTPEVAFSNPTQAGNPVTKPPFPSEQPSPRSVSPSTPPELVEVLKQLEQQQESPPRQLKGFPPRHRGPPSASPPSSPTRGPDAEQGLHVVQQLTAALDAALKKDSESNGESDRSTPTAEAQAELSRTSAKPSALRFHSHLMEPPTPEPSPTVRAVPGSEDGISPLHLSEQPYHQQQQQAAHGPYLSRAY